MNDEDLGRELRHAIAKAADTVDKTGDPYRVIDHVVDEIESELGVEIAEEKLESCREFDLPEKGSNATDDAMNGESQ